jgi:hypothetical protein
MLHLEIHISAVAECNFIDIIKIGKVDLYHMLQLLIINGSHKYIGLQRIPIYTYSNVILSKWYQGEPVMN